MKRLLTTTGVTLLALLACDGGGGAPPVEAVPREQARRIYLDRCAICHGVAGDGQGPRHGSLHATPPDFRRATWRRDSTLGGVRAAIREGRPGTDMPAWKTLSEPEIAGLAEYVLGLGAESGVADAIREQGGSVSD